MIRADTWRRTALICLALAAATLATFWPVLKCGFLGYDDYDYVVQNAHVLRGLTWPSVAWAFTHAYVGNWHPLTWISHMTDAQLFGLKPAGHHGVNLFLHTANVLLLFGFLKCSTGTTWRSAVVAGLFGLHPLHVESVAWVAERKDVLSTFFFILTLWAYVRYAKGKSSVDPPSLKLWRTGRQSSFAEATADGGSRAGGGKTEQTAGQEPQINTDEHRLEESTKGGKPRNAEDVRGVQGWRGGRLNRRQAKNHR